MNSHQLPLLCLVSLATIRPSSQLAARPSVPTQFLAPLAYQELSPSAIEPQGWLRQQLEAMRASTTGHLDETYPKVRDYNGWLGGSGDSWEETPYWLDGALPLAHLLHDKVLLAKMQRYVDWTLTHQRGSGYFGPWTKAEQQAGKLLDVQGEMGEDWWPRMVMLKVLQQHYQATGDARVIPFLTKYFQYQHQYLRAKPLTDWGKARGGDNLLVVYWLYRQTGAPFLLELGALLNQQTTPWTGYLSGRTWAMEAAANQTGTQWMDRHAVNVGMGLKLPVVYSQAHAADPQYAQALRTGWHDIMTLHGLPHGMFSGDEDLHGNLPTQGTELCAIVETMFSLEQAIGITGEPTYMDALERMAYNALPAQTTDDQANRQYFQVANQVQVARGVADFSLPFERGMNNVFGLYAGYTCCTANLHQGWTKLATHLWYATPDQGLAALEYAPNMLHTTAGGTAVTINEATAYPFEDKIRFTLAMRRNTTFPLVLRIPGWCTEATLLLNGQPLRTAPGGQVVRLTREWHPHDQLTLRLPMTLRTSNWAHNSRAVERGPLVYALKMREQWNQGTTAEEGSYFEIKPLSPWNYGLPKAAIEAPQTAFRVVQRPAPEATTFVWNAEHAPIELTTTARRLPDWQLVAGVAHQPVTPRDGVYKGVVTAQNEAITLIPYGCSKLRVVAFPVIP